MDWTSSVFEVIDLRSFSNLWYWIALAVLWSSVSHYLLGVPFDAIQRAKRGTPPSAMADLDDLVRVNINRILYIFEVSGSWIGLFGAMMLTTLGIMAFGYGVEFAQAIFLMAFPMSIVAAMSVRKAQKIRDHGVSGEELIKTLTVHRFTVQAVGMVSIFITAMYGMYKNLYVGPFGGF